MLENNASLIEKIFLLDGGIDEENRKRISEVSVKYDVPVCLIDTRQIEKYLGKNGIPKYKGSYATYYKLFALNFLECETERVLYIDADTVIVRSISELINIDMGNFAVAMAYDALSLRHKKQIGMHTRKYYNGGIILFDYKKWKDLEQKRVMDHIKQKHGVYAVVDQDILNIVFENDIALLPNKYNYTTLNSQFSYRNLCKIFQLKPDYYYEESEVNECKKSAVVYHMLGNFGVQTWHAEGTHPFGKLWDEYLMQSPWRDYRKEPAQLTMINRWQKRLYAVLPHFLYNPIHRIAVEISLDQREKLYRKDV